MIAKDFNQETEKMESLAREIESAKRPNYCIGDSNVLNNFDLIAKIVGITPMQVGIVFALKHFLSVASAAKFPEMKQAEPMIGRFADLKNYNKLLYALWLSAQGFKGSPEDSLNDKFC